MCWYFYWVIKRAGCLRRINTTARGKSVVCNALLPLTHHRAGWRFAHVAHTNHCSNHNRGNRRSTTKTAKLRYRVKRERGNGYTHGLLTKPRGGRLHPKPPRTQCSSTRVVLHAYHYHRLRLNSTSIGKRADPGRSKTMCYYYYYRHTPSCTIQLEQPSISNRHIRTRVHTKLRANH